jgi:hypothetical protein
MLALIGMVLIVLWILGLIGNVAGGFIHLLLIVGLIILLAHFFRGRHSTV